ncbi:MAG TPA: helix-turn-helix domain-containing protein [Candidatus Mediterraneibacter intestinipullorum]|nr:helix-turn-helix domain-containing protein [Candidatus Mediterraneibacter intestinipullorum]
MLTRFGKRLRTLRIEENQRLKDMADKLGVTAAYLSAVENGKRRVPDSWIATLTDEYGLSPEEERELQKLAYEDQMKKDIKINLENANNSEIGLAMSFARRFRNLSDEQVNELQKILDE